MANGHGGRRQGAGRKPGSASQKTREIANQAVKDGLTPLEYMLAVLRDDTADPDRRDRMAVAAAPYIHARLAAIETKVETVGQIEAKITFEEQRRQAVEAIRAAFAERPREIEHVAEKAQEIEQRSNEPDAKTAAEPRTAEPERPKVREFAREGSLGSAPEISRLPARYRPPRLLGSGWAG